MVVALLYSRNVNVPGRKKKKVRAQRLVYCSQFYTFKCFNTFSAEETSTPVLSGSSNS